MESEVRNPALDARPDAPKGKSFALIGVVALGLAVGIGAGWYVVGPKLAKHPAAQAPAVAGEKNAGDMAAGEKGDKGEPAPKMMQVVDNLVLNPAGTGGTRFLMVNATFEVRDAATLELMRVRDAEVRDILLTSLQRKTVEELADPASREQLKVELLHALTPLFPAGALKRVFFPQFVIQ